MKRKNLCPILGFTWFYTLSLKLLSINVVKRGICYQNVCPPVCPSVCLSHSWSKTLLLCLTAIAEPCTWLILDEWTTRDSEITRVTVFLLPFLSTFRRVQAGYELLGYEPTPSKSPQWQKVLRKCPIQIYFGIVIVFETVCEFDCAHYGSIMAQTK